MSTYAYKQFFYVDWNLATVVSLNQKEFGDFYNKVKAERRELEVYECNEVKSYLEENTYSIEWLDNRFYIKLRANNKFYIYTTNWFDDAKNDLHINAAKEINDLFVAKYKIKLRNAFAYSEAEVKNCIPRELHYVNSYKLSESIDNYIKLNASAIDFCSQYPSNICGALPDFNTAVEFSSTVKATEEYPFAFYIKSGLVAEYNKYDTHEWLTHRLRTRLFYTKEDDRVPDCVTRLEDKLYYLEHPEEDTTILCKASKYELTDIYSELYAKRNLDDKKYKAILNKSIGSFHTRKYNQYKLAHLVAVTIARSNKKILDLIDAIKLENIIQVCVDGIIYSGSKEYGVKDKALNKLYQEFTNCSVIILSENRYIVENKGKLVKYKHSSVNYDARRNILIDDNYKPTSIFDIFDWVKVDPLKAFKETIIGA